MSTAKVTFDGQVKIPKEVRDRMGIREGDEIVFIPLGHRAIIERLPRPARNEAQWKAAEEAVPYSVRNGDDRGEA